MCPHRGHLQYVHAEHLHRGLALGELCLWLDPCQLRGRMEGASVLDRHTKCLLCSCAVSLARSLLAHPTCLFSLFFLSPS